MSSLNSAQTPVQKGRVSKASSNFLGFTTVSSSLAQKTGAEYANFYDGPVPAIREKAQATHTAFVELHRGARKGQHVPASVFIKNILAMLLSVDKRAAILCYEQERNFNSICHPVHVPTATEEFTRYFPRVYNTRGTVTVKCRITSSMSILDLKRALMDKLRKHNYYIRPTVLKAVRTGKAGWFYLAHPDLTFRNEFQKYLPALIKNELNKVVEFQIAPENETVEMNNEKVSQRVLVARCPYEDTEKIRTFFMKIFSPDSEVEIGYLARYIFVPSMPVGTCSKSHLLALLKMQKRFHAGVFWYNLMGVRNYDQEVALIPPEKSQEESGLLSQAMTQTDQPHNTQDETSPTRFRDQDVTMEEMEVENASNTCDQEEATKLSLRRLLYELKDEEGDNLIHAVYPSMDATKLFVLCSEQNKESTLEHLHKIEQTVEAIFGSEALRVFFNPNEGAHVHNYPILSNDQQSVVNSIAGLTAVSNPQDSTFHHHSKEVSYASMVSQSPAKRQRNGFRKPVESSLPSDFSAEREKDAQMTSNLNETMARLKQIENNDSENKETLENLSHRLDQQGKDITILGSSLKATNEKVDKVCETQVVQGDTMVKMNSSLSAILQEVTKLNEYNKTFTNMQTESSHGGEVGEP